MALPLLPLGKWYVTPGAQGKGTDLIGVIGWGSAALQVRHLGVVLRYDQRPFELQRSISKTKSVNWEGLNIS